MNRTVDLAVVGGGPCGSLSALTAARLGAKVAVCEEHMEIGVPKHCVGHVSVSGLKQLGLNLPREIIENEIRGAVFYSPSGREFAVERVFPVTYVLDRELLDKHLADLAEEAEVEYIFGARVTSLLLESGCVKGVSFGRRKLTSNIVIDAEGCSSVLLKRAGLQTLERAMVVNAIQADVDRVSDVDADMVEIYVGQRYAPGFFAWIIPKRDGSANVGLATHRGNPSEYMRRFTQVHPVASKKLRGCKIAHPSLHPIPLGGMMSKTYSDGLLVVGDAASQVKPTTGGGIIFGLLCSRTAGEVAYEALKSNNFSADFLSVYQSRWRKLIGFDLEVMRQIRKMLNRISDGALDRIIGSCSRLKIDERLERAGDVDFQGGSLIRMISHPAVPVVGLLFAVSALASFLRHKER